MKTYCVTGHRPNKLGGFDAKSKEILRDFAISILRKHQPKQVISGMTLGWDMAIAKAAICLQIPLICAVPFREQDKKWFQEDKNDYNYCLSKSTKIIYVDEVEGYGFGDVANGKYSPEKMQLRNKWMIDNSEGVLALWRSGSSGGTKNCVDYANYKYEFPKEQIIYLWDNYLEYRESIGSPFVSDVETDSDILAVDVLEEIYLENYNYSNEPKDSNDSDDLGDDSETDDGVADEIAKILIGDDADEIVYPHQLNPDLPFSPYNAVFNDGKRIHIDEDYLAANLNWKPDFDFESCEWEPRRVPDFREAKLLMLDIETLGLDPKEPESRITMIGLLTQGNFLGNCSLSTEGLKKLEEGYILELTADNDDAERLLLNGFFIAVNKLQPDAICTHNGFAFDFPYIMERCEMLGIEHPMTRLTDKERSVTAASIYGQIPRYYPVYWTKPGRNGRIFNDGSFIQLVDTYLLAGIHDKIFANMNKYSLKYLAHYVGFRKEKRLELKGNQIFDYWKSGDPEKLNLLRQYLIYDLEDQQAVSNFFLVSPWYQQMYFPLAFQEICVASPARKHNANLEQFYRKYYNRKITLPDGSTRFYQQPIADEKLSYEGALVDCKKGLYNYFFSLDVSSLYPSLMLVYALMSRDKDVVGVFLKTILTLRSLRYVYKDLGGSNPHKASSRQAYKDFPYLFSDIDFDNISKEDKKIFKGVDNSLKVGINGGYGFLGVGFYCFNDIESAALVTAYGRLIITKMRKVIETYSYLITLDTDGCKATPKKITELDHSLLTNKYFDKDGEIPVDDGNGFVNPIWIWHATQDVLPEGIVIDLEQNCPNGAVYAPAMKNYIFWESPEDEPKLKGVYRKRNRNKLQQQFPIEFIRLWAFEGKNNAHKFSNNTIEKLSGFKISNKSVLIDITIENIKKLKGEEKKLHKLLLESNCGEVGESVTFYWGTRQTYNKKGGKSGKKIFPVRRYSDGRLPNNQKFPCDEKDIDKRLNIKEYVCDSEPKVIPYSQRDNLNEILDMELIEKLMFTQRITKTQINKKTGLPQKNLLADYGMGQPGDSVSFYWASIEVQKVSEKTARVSSKTERFPVRIIVNDDDSITIDMQSIPEHIDTDLINLNINVEWYLNDLLKIRDEILDVVEK